jgi:hypothetical protein
MGDRSGAGLVECAVLEALDSLGARPGRHRKSARVLDTVEERIGLARGYGYEVLLDLARPWQTPLLLVDGQGNFGSRGNDPAANYRYTEAGLSRAGEVVLAAERGDLAPVPVGLINGNVYREGLRPPFRPLAIFEALREAIRRPRVTGEELASVVGPPCPQRLRRHGRLRCDDSRTADHPETGSPRHRERRSPPRPHQELPAQRQSRRGRDRPGGTGQKACGRPGLHGRTHLPLADLRDKSSVRHEDLLVCVPSPGTTAAEQDAAP